MRTGKCIKCNKRTQGKADNNFYCRKCRQFDDSKQRAYRLSKIGSFEFGWLTGLIEGEGCFYCKTSSSKLNDGRYCYPLTGFSLMSTDEDVMQRVSSLLEIGLRGPYYKVSNIKRKVVWSVQVTGYKAVVIMEAFYGSLGVRRQEQIDRAIEWESRGKFKVI